MNKLSPDQRTAFEVLVKKTRDMHERNRLCVTLARDDRLEPDLIAQVLRLSRTSVYDYLRDYQSNEKFQHGAKGGTEIKLSKKQTEVLLKHPSQYTYRKVKDICVHFLTKYKITYSLGGITSWLRKNIFVFKSPVKVPGKLDLEKQVGPKVSANLKNRNGVFTSIFSESKCNRKTLEVDERGCNLQQVL